MVSWLWTYSRTPQYYYLQYLLKSPGSDSSEYQTIVKDVIPYMDLFTTTYVYSLLCAATSYPYVLSESHRRWMRESGALAITGAIKVKDTPSNEETRSRKSGTV